MTILPFRRLIKSMFYRDKKKEVERSLVEKNRYKLILLDNLNITIDCIDKIDRLKHHRVKGHRS